MTPPATSRRILLGAAASLLAAPALAQGFPDRPIRFICPFPAGGIVDLVIRAISDDLAAELGQPVVVNVRTGAGGLIGSQQLVAAPADGHTWLMASLSHILGPTAPCRQTRCRPPRCRRCWLPSTANSPTSCARPTSGWIEHGHGPSAARRRRPRCRCGRAAPAGLISGDRIAAIRTIEHGNFLDEDSARLMAARGAILVPTLVVYRRVVQHAAEVGISAFHLAKAQEVLATGTRSLEIAQRAGVKMALGTDLFRAPKQYQSEELLIRAEALPVADVLRSATLVGAEVVGMQGRLGRVAEGYIADLLVVDGDPLADLGVLQDQGAQLAMILKAGRVVKDRLA